MWKGLLDHYKKVLPLTDNTPLLTLHEGNTPLIRLDKLSEEWELDLYVKLEGANPTGSFKDRGMVLAVAKAVEEGCSTVICASTGNTSASAAAYAARAGLKCIIIIPHGKIAQGKLAQAVMYGAEILAIDGNFDEALDIVRELADSKEIAIVNSINPYRIEGQKTAAYEIIEQLGEAPDILAIPVGNAGNITAYWKGFKEYHFLHKTNLPEMRGYEAEGAAAIVFNKRIDQPETIATAIRIGNPASWNQAVQAADESKGEIDYVTDNEILEMYTALAQKEGIFAEPASCASLAGIFKQRKQGKIDPGQKVVAILTGNGLKDPETAMNVASFEPTVLPKDKERLLNHIRGQLR